MIDPSGLAVDAGEDPAYRSFLAAAPDPGDELLPVELRCEPPTFHGRKIFQAGESWSATEVGPDEVLIAFGPVDGPARVAARFARNVPHVVVTCAPDVLRGGRLPDPVRYPLDQLLLMYRLATRHGVVVHGALVATGNGGVLCPGVSGAGKTTLSQLLRDAPGLEVLSDDRAVVRRTVDGYVAWGTPWPGLGGFAVNRGVPLRAVAFLEKSKAPVSAPLSARDAVARLARVATVPWYDRELGPAVFETVGGICASTPTFTLGFAPDPSVVPVLHELGTAPA